MDPLKALADAERKPYWLDSPARPEPRPRLSGHTTADLVVVGGGFSGLWTALMAKERDPSLDVVLLEGRRIGWAASGRNGGFCLATLTHGLPNGLERWPDEIERLERMGVENLDEIEATLRRHDIDCSFERTGELNVATEQWQLDALYEHLDLIEELRLDYVPLDREQIRAEIDSPTYLGGLWDRSGCAMLDPRPAGVGGCARRACGSGCGCTNAARCAHWTTTAPRSPCAPRTARSPLGRVALGTGVFSPLLR
ncbi:NAD(P)/FAD-dependent oxidoreductase [Nonomuraea ferruginea]